MTSKEDDTLPLPVFSQELSVDVTADEDIIPTTQPLDSGSTKTSKTSENISTKSTQELLVNSTINSTVDDTLPCEALQRTFDKDKSLDFIPDTEAKKIQPGYPKEEVSCRKKLPVFADASHPQSNPLWETPQGPDSPAIDSYQFSMLNDSPKDSQPTQSNPPTTLDQSSTQIIVNDSAETLELEGSPVKKVKAESEGKDVARSEDAEIFESSSALLSEQTEGRSAVDQSEKSMNGTMSEEDAYLMKTVEDSEADVEMSVRVPECSQPGVGEAAGGFEVKGESAGVGEGRRSGEGVREEEGGGVLREQDFLIRELEFKLVVTCFVTFDPKRNKVEKKVISEVRKSPSSKGKSSHVEERLSENTGEKRYSTSSSGSVYSDKLPFELSKRVSCVSENTDSSEDLGLRLKRGWLGLKREREALNRVPWGSEYLLPMKLDELVQSYIENKEYMKRPSLKPKRSRTKEKHRERAMEVSSLEGGSSVGLGVESSEEVRVETPGVEGAVEGEEEGGSGGGGDAEAKGEKQEEEQRGSGGTGEGGGGGGGEESIGGEGGGVEGGEEEEEVRSSVALGEGVSVFARWTDKRYYSGVLCGSEKNDRWEVRFDDGTLKMIREDFILPTQWIEVGSLVFALVGDKYVSGQITEMKRGKEVTYTVALDIEKKNVCTKVSDLCLTDVMAGIMREKYKPLSGTPRKKTEIDFDNVVSGKRLREQRTPLGAVGSDGVRSGGTKRKALPKAKKEVLEAVKETPGASGSGKEAGGLGSESGNVTEDRVVSADSPFGNEVVDGTPVRRTSKETKGKTRPRVLSYETEDIRSTRSKSKSWLTADGTPIPGPSGCKVKSPKGEQARKRAEERPGKETKSSGRSPAAPAAAEKSKKRRKLEEPAENGLESSPKKESIRAKRKSRKG